MNANSRDIHFQIGNDLVRRDRLRNAENAIRYAFGSWSAIGSIELDSEIAGWTTRIVTGRQNDASIRRIFPDDARNGWRAHKSVGADQNLRNLKSAEKNRYLTPNFEEKTDLPHSPPLFSKSTARILFRKSDRRHRRPTTCLWFYRLSRLPTSIGWNFPCNSVVGILSPAKIEIRGLHSWIGHSKICNKQKMLKTRS